MTVSRNRDVNQTPDLPGFRVFGASVGGEGARFAQIFNALKNPESVRPAPIFNAFKIYETRAHTNQTEEVLS